MKAKTLTQDLDGELIKGLRPKFDSEDVLALEAYDDFMDEHHHDIAEKLRMILAKHPVLGAILNSMTTEQLDQQDEESRILQKKAIREQAWDSYAAQLLDQGVAYAQMGLQFSDWSYIVKVYRDYAQPYISAKLTGDIRGMLLTLAGMNKIIDFALNVIAESYFLEKERIISAERDKTREALRQLTVSEAQVRVLFENSTDVIFMVDEHGIILYINHVAEGLEKNEVIGSSFYDYQTPATRLVLEAGVRGVFETGKSSVIDHEAVLKGGNRFYTSSIAPIFEGDQVRKVAVIARDNTEQVLANRRVEEMNKVLEQRVDERTAELQNINRELESFSYTVSHDLRAPIRAIDGFTKVLAKKAKGILGSQENHYLQMIVENTTKMGQLIDDLLAFSRIGRVERQLANFDMAHLIRQVFAELTQLNEKPKISFFVGDLPQVPADREMIKLVWSNLLDNALKFSSTREEVIIKITAEETPQEMIYHIEDNGVGFEMEFVGKVFGVFQRLHSDDEFEGTGVGLAIVQRIVQRHQGRVWAHSELNNGAIFSFSLSKNPIL
ncbi:sensor histidine kinase [Marinoscillum sp.]|uniref:sensor histidine kinase n=1 Tax=Marinoscillum sp. TaxID=2024838 RepID=UPI003BABDD5C